MALQRVVCYGFMTLVILAPLPFGSVQTWASASLVAASFLLGALWVVWRARRGLSSIPWRDPLLLAGVLFALLGVAQMIPLPRSVLESVSPKAVELRDRYEPTVAQAEIAGSEEVTSFAGWRPISLYPWATRQAVLRFFAYLLVALIAVDLCSLPVARRAVVWSLLATGGFEAIYGLAEFLSGRQHIFGYTKMYYTDVATGTFINRNHFAGYLEMTLPLAIALAATAISRVWPERGGSFGERLAKASGRELFTASLLLVLALLMATALVCSRSRMGIFSILVASMATCVLMLWRGRSRSFAAAMCIVSAATFLIFVQSDAGGPVVKRFVTIVSEFRGNLGRWEMWSQTVDMAGAFPVFGIGLGTFGYVFPFFRRTGPGISIAHAHNDYVELVAEAGVLGCVLAVVGAGIVVFSFIRGRAGRPGYGQLGYAAACGVLAIAFHSITDFNLAIPSNALTLAVLLGFLICWRRPSVPILATQNGACRRFSGRAVLPAGLMVAGALVAMAPVAADLAAGGEAQRFSRWIDGDNADRLFSASATVSQAALEDLETLVTVTPDGIFSEPTVDYIARRMEDAIALQSAGLRQLPTSFNGHIAMGHLRVGRCAAAMLGSDRDRDCLHDALPEFRAALQLNPMSASTHAKVARLLITAWPLLGEAERSEASTIVERAREMNPGDRELRNQVLALRDSGPPP